MSRVRARFTSRLTISVGLSAIYSGDTYPSAISIALISVYADIAPLEKGCLIIFHVKSPQKISPISRGTFTALIVIPGQMWIHSRRKPVITTSFFPIQGSIRDLTHSREFSRSVLVEAQRITSHSRVALFQL